MPAHIGIVAGSGEGAALCYRTICLEGPGYLGPDASPEVSLHAHSYAAYARRLEAGDFEGVGALLLSSARKLAAAGADFLICPANTLHVAFAHVAEQAPLPWLHIAEVVAEEAVSRGYRRLGVLGTALLVDSAVYERALADRGLALVRPSDAERDEIDRIIMTQLVRGDFHRGQGEAFGRAMARMKAQGCDAVALACTEIPLAVSRADAPLPMLDSTRLLARAALRRAVGA